MREKCFNCYNLITDITSQLVYFDQIICLSCLEEINMSVHQKATEFYPRLARLSQTEYGRSFSKTFEEYCNAKVKDIVHKLYYRKVLKKQYTKKRHDILKYLPRTLTRIQFSELKKNAVCALTGSSDDITLDHFIPLEWGHGGEYIGNIYFMKRKLNASKSNLNPFKWIKKISLSEDIDMFRWDNLVKRLAEENGISVKQFKCYVNWCEKNKRSKEQLIADDCSSLELWKSIQ